jgi:hypothetical protein
MYDVLYRWVPWKMSSNNHNAKGMSITQQTVQVKATETAKSLALTNFKAG